MQVFPGDARAGRGCAPPELSGSHLEEKRTLVLVGTGTCLNKNKTGLIHPLLTRPSRQQAETAWTTFIISTNRVFIEPFPYPVTFYMRNPVHAAYYILHCRGLFLQLCIYYKRASAACTRVSILHGIFLPEVLLFSIVNIHSLLHNLRHTKNRRLFSVRGKVLGVPCADDPAELKGYRKAEQTQNTSQRAAQQIQSNI